MKIILKIGPAVMTFHSDHAPHDWDESTSFYPDFQVDEPTSPSLEVYIHQNPAPAREGGILVGEYPDNWQLFEQAGQWRLEVMDPQSMQLKHIAFFNRSWNRAEVYIIPRTYAEAPDFLRHGGWALVDVMEPLIQWWLTLWLALNAKGLIFHSSAMAFNGQGMVFVGASGAGKTTIARWAKTEGSALLLSDERNVLWHDGTQWLASGTPWHGELRAACPATVPVTRVSMLVKAPVNHFSPLAPAVFAGLVLQEAFLPLWNAQAMHNVLELAGRLAVDISTGRMHCVNDISVIPYLKSLLEEREKVFR